MTRPARLSLPTFAVPTFALALAATGAAHAASPTRITDRGYGGLYTADARCIRQNLPDYMGQHSYTKFGEAAGACGIKVPDLTNDHELQLAARIIGAAYVISVKDAADMDNWAVCRPLGATGPAQAELAPYRCQWLHVRSAPADRAAVDATLPRAG